MVVYRNNNRLKHWRQGLYGYLVMRKSMDDELLRQQIIEILQNAGSSSTKEDLNMAVMNMLKILPSPVGFVEYIRNNQA